jgi:hypothetical protein
VTLTDEAVLDEHARLTSRLRYPAPALQRFMVRHARQSVMDAGQDAVRHMFWPLLPPGGEGLPPELGITLPQMIGGDLFTAETVKVTTVMAEAMLASAANADEPGRLDAAEIPFESAFCWLDKTWGVPDAGGEIYPLRAVSWRLTAVSTKSGWWPGVRVAFWTWIPDDVAEGRYSHADALEITGRLGSMLLAHVTIIPLGSEFDLPKGSNPLEIDSAHYALILLRVLWAWLSMEITDTSVRQPGRQAVKRAARHLQNPALRVVMLRKVRHASDPEGTSRDIDWACQWWVRGHHRHIEPYDTAVHARGHEAIPNREDPDRRCIVCGARTTWVKPHVKGPDGAPLRVSKVMFKLAR